MTVAAANGLTRVRERVYLTGRAAGESGRELEAFPTAMKAEAGSVLRHLAQRERAVRTIETGFAFGLSAMFILEGALAAGAGAVRHVAIDPFQKRDWDNAGLRALREAGVSHLLELVEEDSALALPRMVAEGRRFDMGFVDGGHLFENAFIDIFYLQRLVRPGGLIVIDDLWMPAIRAAVAYFTRNAGMAEEGLDGFEGAKRFSILRTPESPVKRPWDHFVEFRS